MRHQACTGLPILSRFPITMELMRVLQKALDLNNADHGMPWAACCVGFFVFFVFRVGEFTVNSTFDPEIHLSINNLQVDCLLNPSCVMIHIKCSKTDSFHSGCDIYLGKVNSDICPLAAIGSYLHVRGDAPGPLFLSEMEDLYHGKFWPPRSNTSCTRMIILGLTPCTVFELIQPPQQPHVEYQIT